MTFSYKVELINFTAYVCCCPRCGRVQQCGHSPRQKLNIAAAMVAEASPGPAVTPLAPASQPG